jgi:hypothetical protein
MFYPPYDSGDHLHPNDAGYQAMANAVDLGMLLHPRPQPPVIGYLPHHRVTVAPGGSATVQVAASNTTSQPQVAHVRLTPPAGLTVAPVSVNITVPPNATSTASVSVRASASAPRTFYPVPVAFAGDTRAGPGQSLDLTVLVARPGSLLTAFNNTGISNDTDVPAADFDYVGNSYSAQALAAAGLSAGKPVTVNGVTFTWPLPAPGYPDNASAQGQQVKVNAPAGTQTLGFLGSGTGGPGRGGKGIATLHYSDGTTAQYWLGLSDWTLDAGSAKPSYGNQVVATMPYANCDTCSSGQTPVSTYVFYAALPINPGKKLTSVTLPSSAAPACADYDGDGFSYSATGLANVGLTPGAAVTAGNLTFTWPSVTPCAPDNILAAGETMLVNGKAGETTLGLLGSSTSGGSQGTIVINYTDGTSSTQTLSFNDWAGGPGNGNTAVATMPYRNSVSGSSQALTMYVYATTVPVDPSKTVASVVFPDVSNNVGVGVTAMHIFALALGS